MGKEPEKSGLEEAFRKKEEAVQAKEKAEGKQEEATQKPADIVTEQEVTRQIETAKKKVEKDFHSEKSKEEMMKALDELTARQKDEVEKSGDVAKDKLTELFNKTKAELAAFKEQPEVKKVYEPLSKLVEKKKEYLTAINVDKYGLTDKKDQGYWVTIQEELKGAGITQDDVEKVQTILGLEPDGKIGPKTIDATWEMLTGEPRNVKNVIREKGKTVKAKSELVDAIIAQDKAKEDAEVKQQAAAGQAEATNTIPKTQSVAPLVAAEGEKQAPAEAPLVTEEDVKIVLKGTYNFIKPEIIDQSEVRITNTGETSIETKYVSPSGGELLFEGIWGEPGLDKITIKLSKGNGLSEFIVKGKEDAAKADKKTVITSESLPNDQKEVSVFDENGKVRTEFAQAEIDRLLVYENTESNPFYMGPIQILDFGPEQITAKTNFDTTGREKIEVDITEITKISEKEVQLYMRDGIDKGYKLKARKITLPKPQRGDLVGIRTPFGGYIYKIYDGEWSRDKKKGEKAIKITG